jgi:hypothetical protein
MAREIGLLIAAGMVRFGSIAIALYVAWTLGGEAIDLLNGTTEAFRSALAVSR